MTDTDSGQLDTFSLFFFVNPLTKYIQISLSIFSIKIRFTHNNRKTIFQNIQIEKGLKYIVAWCTQLAGNSRQSNGY